MERALKTHQASSEEGEDGSILAQTVEMKSNYTLLLSGADSFIVLFFAPGTGALD